MTYKFDITPAKECHCRTTDPKHICAACKKVFHAGIEPSVFVGVTMGWLDIKGNAEQQRNSSESSCDWVCSKKCANFWIIQRM
jgi:hypothetical protein